MSLRVELFEPVSSLFSFLNVFAVVSSADATLIVYVDGLDMDGKTIKSTFVEFTTGECFLQAMLGGNLL